MHAGEAGRPYSSSASLLENLEIPLSGSPFSAALVAYPICPRQTLAALEVQRRRLLGCCLGFDGLEKIREMKPIRATIKARVDEG